ncbi:MAG: hypothetical protein QG555_415 [Thermodesulfobacteriota bacterium]|nr:hypothetical protein [Thermodesulfobacteriota bacterium]
MALQLMDSVRQILAAVEKSSGKTITYIENPDLSAPFSFNIDGKDNRQLKLIYRPDDDDINYAVANQAGHLLRLFAAPREERFVSIANRQTMARFIMETESELERLSALLGRDKVRKMISLWYQGVVFQLTRMPPDIMVNKWLYDDWPELRPCLRQAIAAQQRQAIPSLSPDVRRTTPARIYRAANIMNFVFFKCLEDHLHADFIGPYHGTIFILAGAPLARITANDHRNDHGGDLIMIDRWASELELNNWYEWQPYVTFRE